MVQQILKMGGCKTMDEFYRKYPTEESFLEVFPQARPMMEQFAKGGALDIEAFPTAAPNVSNYGMKTPNIPLIFQMGGGMNQETMAQQDGMQQPMYPQMPDMNQDPLIALLEQMSQNMNVDSAELLEIIQSLPPEILDRLRVMAANDPSNTAKQLLALREEYRNGTNPVMKTGGKFDTPPTADQFYQTYPKINIPMIMADGGDIYGGSVFNYGQFPPIMNTGGSIPMNAQETYIPSKLQEFMQKVQSYSQANQEKEMAEQMMQQHQYYQDGGQTQCPDGEEYDEYYGGCLPAKPEGTFTGYDRAGNAFSINPEMKKKYDRGWRPGDVGGPSNIFAAEAVLTGLSGINSLLENKETKKQEFQMQQQLYDPMNWAGSYPTDKGDWDQFGNFRPDKRVFTGSFPMAKSGLEVKMRAGLGFNANQLSWPVMAGEFSEPDLEVKSTIGPIDRDKANLEAEVGETAVTNLRGDGVPEHYKIGGKRHYAGGTPLNLPDNSYIFSRDKSMKIKDKDLLANEFGITNVKKGGIAPADVAKKYDLNKYKKILLDPNTDDLARSTAEANIKNGVNKLGKLALIQESMKSFPDGVPMISMPYIQSVGIDPQMFAPKEPALDDAQQPAQDMARYGKSVNRLKKFQVPPGEYTNKNNVLKGPDIPPVDVIGKTDPLWGIEPDSPFLDPNDNLYMFGKPFLDIMNNNAAGDIYKTKQYYDPFKNSYVAADKNNDGKLDEEEWKKIKDVITEFKNKLIDPLTKNTWDVEGLAGFGSIGSWFTGPRVYGNNPQQELDDMYDVLDIKINNFEKAANMWLDKDANTITLNRHIDLLKEIKTEIEKLNKLSTDEKLKYVDPNTKQPYYTKLQRLETKKKNLENYLTIAQSDVNLTRNPFVRAVSGGRGAMAVEYIGGSETRIPSYEVIYPEMTETEVKEILPAAGSDEDTSLKNITDQYMQDMGVAVSDQDYATYQELPDQAADQSAAASQNKVQKTQKQDPFSTPGWENNTQLRDQYLRKAMDKAQFDTMPEPQKQYMWVNKLFSYAKGGQTKIPLPKAQTGFNTTYRAAPGYTAAGPSWYDPNITTIGSQSGSAFPVDPVTGIRWASSKASNKPTWDYFETYPEKTGRSADIWKQYPGGFAKWKTDMAAGKGNASDASKFWAETVVNPYVKGITGQDYITMTASGKVVPGYQWSTAPIYTAQPSQPPQPPSAPPPPSYDKGQMGCDCRDPKDPTKSVPGTIDSKGNCKCPDTIPSINPASPQKTPFWTEDIINMGAALRNVNSIRKYLPWQAKSPFYAAEPTFESPERAISAQNEGLNIGAQSAAQFSNPQAFAANFSKMAGTAGANTANIIADVNNRNVQTANQFEMANKQAYNQYMQNQADRSTNMYDKWTIANQQFDNAKRQAKNEARKQVVNAWTNRGKASILNRMYADQFKINTTTGELDFYNPKNFEYEQPKASEMPDDLKVLYDKAIARNTVEGDKLAAEIYQDWVTSRNSNKAGKNRSGDDALLEYLKSIDRSR